MKVQIGNIAIGDGERIAIQSMCNTKTTDIDGSIKQIIELESYGCDIVRLSVPDMESAVALKEIIKAVHIPVVADIHFDYRLAIASCDSGVSKVRINPGNIGNESKVRYVAEYLNERNIPIRIGVNGGSLEKQYSNLPLSEAMCKSALAHVGLLEKYNFYNTIISVKSSDVRTNVEAYRLLRKSCDYPLHVGVTEAGVYEKGVIKSAIGIGSLLLDGIGDTIRVSLSDEPYKEVIVAKEILNSLDLGDPHIEVISCPTCARTNIDVSGLANMVVKATKDIKKNGKIAVMGCVVNGPGEASRCDFGVAGGKDKSAIFVKGQVVKTVKNEELIGEILQFISKL
ncbi:MAG: flavodoxin-dependent (E)-4-hydroxy-3-methylbut-2-enyl-diphosphate synthase [Clostridia bacterium]|nr:flavodoxin-dependent (E)-4-hydroxy-3-methylbut-2-enyl-diphosphate synthase [Clostridia bacterium]